MLCSFFVIVLSHDWRIPFVVHFSCLRGALRSLFVLCSFIVLVLSHASFVRCVGADPVH